MYYIVLFSEGKTQVVKRTSNILFAIEEKNKLEQSIGLPLNIYKDGCPVHYQGMQFNYKQFQEYLNIKEQQ